jgi:hypothetical protein
MGAGGTSVPTRTVRREEQHVRGRVSWFLWTAAALAAVVCACSRQTAQTFGYNPQVRPGISRERAIALLGKPQDEEPFALSGTAVHADVLTYPFGQVLVENGSVVAVSIDNDPAFVGPFGVRLGMSDDELRAALAAHPGVRVGQKETYDAISQSRDTPTIDLYDVTDGAMIELTSADPLSPARVAQVTLANHAGMALLEAFTKARLEGVYPDVHLDNYISNPWKAGHA